MCAYSTINGVYACQNPTVLNIPLYQQSGFGGFVTSDWGAAHSTVDSVNGGMTMEMPNGYFYADFLSQAVAAGTVTTAQINTMVTRVLTQMFAFGLFDHAPTGSPTATVTTPAHATVALQGAEEGTVLLKNTGILPLSHVGADVDRGDRRRRRRRYADDRRRQRHRHQFRHDLAADGHSEPRRRHGRHGHLQRRARNQASAVTLAQQSSVAIVFASDNYGNEGSDTSTINLPNSQDALISAVVAANPKTIVVLNDNDAILMPWLDSVPAVFEGFYDGQQWGTAIAALLFGDVNPSGKLPVTFPTSLSQVPASTTAQWPGANNTVQYSEGAEGRLPLVRRAEPDAAVPVRVRPVVHARFGFSNLQVGALSGGQATVTATVTNTGTRAGTEVAQLYVGRPGRRRRTAAPAQGLPAGDAEPGRGADGHVHRADARAGALGHRVELVAGDRRRPTRSWSATRPATCR